MTLTHQQQLAFAIAPKPSATLSFASSAYVLYSILTCPERRRRVYHRLIAAMSCWNLLMSAVCFWGTWAFPSASSSGVPSMLGAAGTDRTCTAQGFLIMLALVSPCYYCSLSLLAFLSVRDDFSGAGEARRRKMEPWIHVCVVIAPVTMSAWGVHMDFFNPAGPWCFMSSYPPGCDREGSPDECLRGGAEEMAPFRIAFYGVLLFFYAFATVMMVALYVMVRRREKKREQLVGKRQYEEKFRRKKSKIVARQAGLYLATFYAVYCLPLISRLIEWITGELFFPTLVLMAIFVPLQGFLNMLVYELTRIRGRDRQVSNAVGGGPLGRRGSSWSSKFAASTLATAFFSRVQESDGKNDSSSVDNDNEAARRRSRRALESETNTQMELEFSIFDGTSPSSQWAEYFENESDEGEEGCLPDVNKADSCEVLQETMAVSMGKEDTTEHTQQRRTSRGE